MKFTHGCLEWNKISSRATACSDTPGRAGGDFVTPCAPRCLSPALLHQPPPFIHRQRDRCLVNYAAKCTGEVIVSSAPPQKKMGLCHPRRPLWPSVQLLARNLSRQLTISRNFTVRPHFPFHVPYSTLVLIKNKKKKNEKQPPTFVNGFHYIKNWKIKVLSIYFYYTTNGNGNFYLY